MPKAPAKKPTVTEKKSADTPSVPKDRNGSKIVVPPKSDDPAVIYPELDVRICRGENALTAELAKQLIGWEVETESNKFGNDYFIKDEYGNKVRCHRNTTNRVYQPQNVEAIKQEILMRNWQLNCETIIIGQFASALSAQHRLIGLILAAQEWERNKEKWEDYWITEPVMETLIAFGCSEEDRVVNTIETGKVRTLTDVFFRSETFAKYGNKDKKTLSRICEKAISRLWDRTGAGLNSRAPIRTHSESAKFFNRHPRIRDCVKHVWEENGDGEEGGKIVRYLPLGEAAALMYMMGSSATDPGKYRSAEEPSEADLDWENWDLANEFFVKLASGAKDFLSIRTVLTQMLTAELEGEDGEMVTVTVTSKERMALIAKAWECVVSGNKITPAAIKLEYHTDPEKGRLLAECPVVGGIDLGVPKDDEPTPPPTDPTPEEIEKGKAVIRKEREEKEAAEAKRRQPKRGSNQLSRRSKRPFEIDQKVWVTDSDDTIWEGHLVEIEGQTARVRAGGGGVFETPVDSLSHKAPA